MQGEVYRILPDTGYCDSAVELAQYADLLIAECAFRPGEENEHWPHLNPETAAKLALDAQAKRLVLVHFDAFRYPDMESRSGAALVARQSFSPVSAAFDNQIIEM